MLGSGYQTDNKIIKYASKNDYFAKVEEKINIVDPEVQK